MLLSTNRGRSNGCSNHDTVLRVGCDKGPCIELRLRQQGTERSCWQFASCRSFWGLRRAKYGRGGLRLLRSAISLTVSIFVAIAIGATAIRTPCAPTDSKIPRSISRYAMSKTGRLGREYATVVRLTPCRPASCSTLATSLCSSIDNSAGTTPGEGCFAESDCLFFSPRATR